jgi:hypothetical protein
MLLLFFGPLGGGSSSSSSSIKSSLAAAAAALQSDDIAAATSHALEAWWSGRACEGLRMALWLTHGAEVDLCTPHHTAPHAR